MLLVEYFYQNSLSWFSCLFYVIVVPIVLQNLDSDSIASINMKNIIALAETLVSDPNRHVEWLINSGNESRFSRTLFLAIVLQTLVAPSEGISILFNI
jgi:U3 small nucleolar RNA-associated protein 10